MAEYCTIGCKTNVFFLYSMDRELKLDVEEELQIEEVDRLFCEHLTRT